MKPDNSRMERARLTRDGMAGKTLRKWLILFFLFVSPTFAQIKTITGGGYQNTNGSPCAGCILYLQLVADATVTGTDQIVPSTNSYTLDANGNVPANSPLWANDQMQPSGLTYQATLTLPGGGRIWGPEFLYISGPSPISLTQLVPVASSSVFFAAPALLGVANTFTAINTFAQQIISTVTTGTAPFSIASTTVVPNLNAQLHNGLTAPASAIVGISDTQTLTNKTLTAPVINSLNLPSSGVTLLNGQGNVGPITGNSSAQTVYTYTLPASTVANLKAFRINLSYQHAGSASVTFATTFNGITMQTWSSAAAQGLEHLTLINTGSASCAIEGFALTNTPAVAAAGAGNVASGLAWASSQVINFTFNVANTDTVTGMQFVVELIQ